MGEFNNGLIVGALVGAAMITVHWDIMGTFKGFVRYQISSVCLVLAILLARGVI
ncbi:hypothetical protein KFO32_05530 [Pantoea ananatis]|uniref:hypothetical protein n=1 Tax=Pantoea ananas TaxID=553 RepID=UPI001FF2FC0A|nr:hypothetical protein [Pantoea ananatis]MCK0552537.1 hypothetical protein [Pantoea ananatis]